MGLTSRLRMISRPASASFDTLHLTNLIFGTISKSLSPYINRFLSADTIVLGYANPQSLNRYSYVVNDPMRYTDPTGHMQASDDYEDSDGKCGSNDKGCNDLVKRIKDKQDKDKGTGPITNAILNLPGSADFYSGAAIGLDGVAWLTDSFATGVVIYGGVFGAGLGIPGTAVGGPAVPTVTGLAGAIIAELYVQPILNVGNAIASLSTAATVIADTKTGNTRIENGIFSSNVKNSFTLTSVGWANKEAGLSLAIQSLALINDFGWTSLPFHSTP